MSRIGRKPILIPLGVEVKAEGDNVKIKGPKGELVFKINPEIKIEIKDNQIFVEPKNKESRQKEIKSLWGLNRVLLDNMIKGVVSGYEKKLQLEGIGYRASLEGENLVMQLGFSHPVKIQPAPGIKFVVEKNIITISGIDKELVGQTAAKIRAVKPPEPYKGKGIRYVGEIIRKKLGKKAVTAGS